MIPADAFLYEYSVVRYVPRVDREEFLNIGLIMMCKRRKWLKGKILINEKRILNFDATANLSALSRQASMFEKDGLPDPLLPVEERYRWLSAVKSAVLQTSPSHPGYILPKDEPDVHYENVLENEFQRLFALLVE